MMRYFVILFIGLMVSLAVKAKPLDSLRVETIKGQKFIIHKVDKNETLADIIKRYKVSLAELTKHNEIKKNKVAKNDIIRIPFVPIEVNPVASSTKDSITVDEAHANAQAQEVQKVYTHVVTPGETLTQIAKKYKLTVAQLSKWNGLKANKIAIGQTLIVDEAATAKPFYKINGPESQLPVQPQSAKLATSDLIEQQGVAVIDETAQVLHPDAPVGTIIKVINLENGKQCLVKVTGQLDTTKYKSFIISIGKEAQEKLSANSVTLRVKLVYVVKP